MFARPSPCRALAALIALGLILTVKPVLAQAPAPQPSPASILLAKQILDLKGVKALFEPMVRGVVVKARDQFLQTNFMWAKDLSEVSVQMQKEYAPRVNELMDAAARIYASHFTEAELKQVLAFYQTPLGQKVIVEEPKTLDESMVHAGEWAEGFADEVIAKMRAEMRKRGHDL